eukprot:scaffold22703_cov57-Phaeocystis_antarctica.AAC.1
MSGRATAAAGAAVAGGAAAGGATGELFRCCLPADVAACCQAAGACRSMCANALDTGAMEGGGLDSFVSSDRWPMERRPPIVRNSASQCIGRLGSAARLVSDSHARPCGVRGGRGVRG